MDHYSSSTELLRAEIAVAAARMIAEDGMDYSTAKRKAAKQILGNAKVRGDILPDNMQIEEEVRQYNELFLSETQPARLLHLRKLALQIMEQLLQFNPYLTGAVLNGTAGNHSDIYLQLFTDSAKNVEIFLLNKNVSFEISESSNFRARQPAVETISFMWQNEGVHLMVYETNDLRGAVKESRNGLLTRADFSALQSLIVSGEQK